MPKKQTKDIVRFRVLVELPGGTQVWEDYAKQVGESNYIPNHGSQPVFTGDIAAWGEAVVGWFNKDELPEKHRKFIRAEMVK